jgi:hypothetical protein
MLGGADSNRRRASSVESRLHTGRGWPALAKTRGRRRDDECWQRDGSTLMISLGDYSRNGSSSVASVRSEKQQVPV